MGKVSIYNLRDLSNYLKEFHTNIKCFNDEEMLRFLFGAVTSMGRVTLIEQIYLDEVISRTADLLK